MDIIKSKIIIRKVLRGDKYFDFHIITHQILGIWSIIDIDNTIAIVDQLYAEQEGFCE